MLLMGKLNDLGYFNPEGLTRTWYGDYTDLEYAQSVVEMSLHGHMIDTTTQ